MSRAADRPDGTDPDGADAAAELDALGYAEALTELEAILAGLEREAVDVDHLAERVQRAAALIRLCRSRLASARIEIETVLTDLERATDEDGS
jgi:exodeoxyribonuclease VII small subunit